MSKSRPMLVRNVMTPLQAAPDLREALAAKLKLPASAFDTIETQRRAIDARKRNHLRYNFTLLVSFAGEPCTHPDVRECTPSTPQPFEPIALIDRHPYVIGAGPAGLFSALALCERGFKPVIFDRGDSIDQRAQHVGRFWATGELDADSNVQFGEGGAGAFSDGKLTARGRDWHAQQVFARLIEFGAPPHIAIDARPHLGTDGMRDITRKIREHLEAKGCRFYWRSRLEDITVADGRLQSVRINGERHTPQAVILAIGNAARDTFSMLFDHDIELHAKAFAAGFRIEHRQAFLNDFFYGAEADVGLAGPATYRLATNVNGRGVYSFCMCPGGEVVAAASELEGQVVNGMSWSARDGRWGNAAIVAQAGPEDFGSHPLAGVEFQRRVEQKAWRMGYVALAQAAAAFIGAGRGVAMKGSYRPAMRRESLGDIYPKFITRALKTALKRWDARGFSREGLLIAAETRTSSPVRIVRHEQTRASVTCEGLYPVGEGAGYAGGIVSSAADGLRTGERFILTER